MADPLPIAQLAARLSISPRQLERLFQSVMGVRPAQHYRLLRLRYARWLLDHTDLSITEIALDAGFADCAHFSRKFKALHGFTPTDARPRERAALAMTRRPACLWSARRTLIWRQCGYSNESFLGSFFAKKNKRFFLEPWPGAKKQKLLDVFRQIPCRIDATGDGRVPDRGCGVRDEGRPWA